MKWCPVYFDPVIGTLYETRWRCGNDSKNVDKMCGGWISQRYWISKEMTPEEVTQRLLKISNKLT